MIFDIIKTMYVRWDIVESNNQFNTSDYMADIDIVYVTKKILKKSYIKNKSISFAKALFYSISGLIFTLIGFVIIFSKGLSNSSVIPVLIGFSLFSIFIVSIKDNSKKIKKINQNEFLLSHATIESVFEDTTTEDKNSVCDCYITYICNGLENKQIKVKLPCSPKKNYKNNPQAYFAFLTNDESSEDEPFLLFLGKDYEIDKNINLL